MDSTITTVSAITIRDMIEVVRTATAEECCELLTALNKGMPLYNARVAATEDEPAVSPPRAAARKPRATGGAGGAKKAAAAPAPLPLVGVPDEAYYRLTDADIDDSVCLGRTLTEKRKDTRWSPAVYWEDQCGKPAVSGGLCAACAGKLHAYTLNPKPGKWHGTLREEPLSWLHMLGTAWATCSRESGKLKWLGGAEPSDGDSASTAGSVRTSASSVRSAPKAATGGAGAAAAKAKKAAPAPPPALPAGVQAKAAADVEPIETAGETCYHMGEVFLVRKGGRAYVLDMIAGEAMDYVGRYDKAADTMDRDTPEGDEEEDE